MKITIVDWMGGSQLIDAPYKHQQVVGGTSGTAQYIAWSLFEAGFNVMISKSTEPGDVVLFADTRRFTQR
jgi:hypothetical protein